MLNPNSFLEDPFPGLLPENPSFYRTTVVRDSLQAKATDSGLMCNVTLPATRTNLDDHFVRINNPIESIISQHMRKMRQELEETLKQQTRLLVSAMVKKLREKEEQIQRIQRLNMVLQERVKSMSLENQLWRDSAQSNEATVNSLRKELEQALARGIVEDAESCCASDDGNKRKCRMCREREPCVLVLPCRHLCLCGVCGSGSKQVQACPACNARMNATLHLNMSFS